MTGQRTHAYNSDSESGETQTAYSDPVCCCPRLGKEVCASRVGRRQGLVDCFAQDLFAAKYARYRISSSLVLLFYQGAMGA